MGKSKRPLPGELYAGNMDEYSEYSDYEDGDDEDDLYAQYEGDDEIEAELLDGRQALQYLNEAHDALARLNQKSHKRGQQQHRRSHRSESWQ